MPRHCGHCRLVTHSIRFQCSDRELIAAPGESILDTAIRAGLNVDYGCNNGNCGRCVARVIEGEIQKIRHHDYVAPAADKAQQSFLMCSYAAASELVVDAQLGDTGAAIPAQTLRARVKTVKELAGVRIVSLRTPRSQRLRFLAGQYAQLSGKNFGELQCSIASCPCEDRWLEFHVPRARDEFSDYVFNLCRAGDEWDVTAPCGNFSFSEDYRRPAVFIAFENGFAPVKSLIEHITGQEEEVQLHLYWIASNKPYLDNLCRAWHDAFDNFTYTPVILGGALEALGDEALRGFARHLAAAHQGLSASDAYVCAPTPLGDVVAGALLEQGLDSARLRREPVRGTHC